MKTHRSIVPDKSILELHASTQCNCVYNLEARQYA